MADQSAVVLVEQLYSAYIVMSSFSLTSFILGLVGFYNLSLMYVFLHIQTVPSFTSAFMYNLAKVFYARNAVPNIIKQKLNKTENETLFSFERQLDAA